jgi:enoyl-[acyl-carrier protein] reductase I
VVQRSNEVGYGAALAFRRAGAELMLTYGRPSTEQYVGPLFGELGAPPDLLHCDVRDDAQLEALFALIEAKRARKLGLVAHCVVSLRGYGLASACRPGRAYSTSKNAFAEGRMLKY